jgi:hypothetical protein
VRIVEEGEAQKKKCSAHDALTNRDQDERSIRAMTAIGFILAIRLFAIPVYEEGQRRRIIASRISRKQGPS